MAIGLIPRPRGLFGARPTASPFPAPSPAPEQAQMGLQQPLPQPEAPQERRGLFAGFNKPGGTAERLYALGGLMQGDTRAVGNYHAMQQQRLQEAAKMQQAEMARETEWQEWLRRKEWERDNPAAAPDAFERAISMAGIDPTSEEGRALARQRAESMARDPMDEFVVVPIPGRGTYAGPRSGLPEAMGQSQAPTQPVGRLTPIQTGGGGGNVTGGFPR